MKSISDLTFLSLNTEAVDHMKVDIPDRGSNSIAEKFLVNNLYASIYSYSRAAVLKRFNKHEASTTPKEAAYEDKFVQQPPKSSSSY